MTEYTYTTAYQYTYLEGTKTPAPDPSGVSGSSAQLTSESTYDLKTGLVKTTTDANGQTTHFYYTDESGQPDPLSRLRKVENPDSGWTSYEYGNTPFSFYVRTRTAVDASHATDSYQYFDGLGRPSRSYSRDGSAPDRTWITVKTTYDNMGRTATVSNPQFGTNLDDFTAGSITTTVYDYLGRARTVTTPDGAHVTTSYEAELSAALNGKRVTVTDQAGKVTSSVTDALGRLVKITEAPGVAGYGYETSYEYDLLGNLLQDPSHTYSYDGENKLASADGGWNCTTNFDSLRQRYTGYERDDELGLDFAQARYYSSRLGRFTSTDPLLASGRSAMPQSWNRYTYVLNNPLVLVDSTGLSDEGGTTIRHEAQTLVTVQPGKDILKIDTVDLGRDDNGNWKTGLKFTVSRPDGNQRGDVTATSSVEGNVRHIGGTVMSLSEQSTAGYTRAGEVHLEIGENGSANLPDLNDLPDPATVVTPTTFDSIPSDVTFTLQITGHAVQVLSGYHNEVPVPRELIGVPVRPQQNIVPETKVDNPSTQAANPSPRGD